MVPEFILPLHHILIMDLKLMTLINRNNLLFLSSVFLGFNQPIFFILSTILWGGWGLFRGFFINKRMCLMSFFFMSYVILFYSRPEYISNADYKDKVVVFFLFFIFFLFQVYSSFGRVAEPSIVKFLMWSIFAKISCVCIYSQYIGGYGYGLLYDPFAGQEVNSPAYSNQLAICLVYFLLMIFNREVVCRWVYFLFLLIGLYFAFFLGGRFLFVALIVSLVLLIFKLRFRTVIAVSVSVLISFMLVYYFGKSNYYVALMLERFSGGGSNSLRFLHIIDGIGQLMVKPLGGFYVDPAIEDTHWFHNIILDSAKVFGYVILSPLFMMFFVFGLSAIRGYIDRNGFYLSIMSFTLFIVMMQDVVMEYNIILMMLYFLYSIDLFTLRYNVGRQR